VRGGGKGEEKGKEGGEKEKGGGVKGVGKRKEDDVWK